MDIRPTADRLRETLFDVLTAGNPAALEGTAWLDLYAGTGAVGIEALSRGAAMVYFVESSAAPAELIRRNLQSLGIAGGFEVLRTDVVRALKTLEGRGIFADYVFLDPPYRLEEEYGRTLNALSHSRLLKPESLIIAEHHKKLDPGETLGELRRYRKLLQGDAALSFFRRV
jgi:16S rRNA (guanine(966)-N(2))-methyltransferase RsmD